MSKHHISEVWFEHWRHGPGFIARYSRRKGWMSEELLQEERACQPECKGGMTACQCVIDGHSYTTWARCPSDMSFNYHLARDVSFGRMTKMLARSELGTREEITEWLLYAMNHHSAIDDCLDWFDDDLHGYDSLALSPLQFRV